MTTVASVSFAKRLTKERKDCLKDEPDFELYNCTNNCKGQPMGITLQLTSSVQCALVRVLEWDSSKQAFDRFIPQPFKDNQADVCGFILVDKDFTIYLRNLSTANCQMYALQFVFVMTDGNYSNALKVFGTVHGGSDKLSHRMQCYKQQIDFQQAMIYHKTQVIFNSNLDKLEPKTNRTKKTLGKRSRSSEAERPQKKAKFAVSEEPGKFIFDEIDEIFSALPEELMWSSVDTLVVPEDIQCALDALPSSEAQKSMPEIPIPQTEDNQDVVNSSDDLSFVFDQQTLDDYLMLSEFDLTNGVSNL